VRVLQALEAIDAQYRNHPQALSPAFQAEVIWPALRAADPDMPPHLHARGRPGEEHDWPLLFWAGLTQRITAHRQADAWSAGQSAEQLVLAWIQTRQADAAQLHADWTAQEGQERQLWGAPDTDVYGPLHTRLAQGLQTLQAFERDVKAGTFRPALARLLIWESTVRPPTRTPSQPHAQLQAWLDDVTRVLHVLQDA